MKISNKYFAFLIMVLAMIFCFAACGGKNADTDTEVGSGTETVSTVSETTADDADTTAPETNVTDTTESETNTPETEIDLDEIVLPTEDDFSNPDFVIEKGVLTQYLGSDAVVTVPDTVGEIAEYAFSHSPTPENITEIRLGKNVGIISPKAFFELDNLVAVDVGENKMFGTFAFEYIPKSCVLYKKDRSVFFCFEYDKGQLDFLDVNFNRAAYCSDVLAPINFVCGNAILKIVRNEGEMIFDDVPGWLLESIEYGEITKIFDEERCIVGNLSTYAFEVDGTFVFTVNYYNWANGCVITKDEVIDVSASDYESVSVSLYRGEDKKLRYKMIDDNYTAMQFDMISPTITSRDQYYGEDGTVEIENGRLVLNKENTYTLTDYMAWRGKTLDEWYSEKEDRDFNTLDELIAANVKRAEEEKG